MRLHTNRSTPRQCAWCGRLLDRKGQWISAVLRLLPDATHGICPSCKRRSLRRYRSQRHRDDSR